MKSKRDYSLLRLHQYLQQEPTYNYLNISILNAIFDVSPEKPSPSPCVLPEKLQSVTDFFAP